MARIICGVDVSSAHLDARLGPDGPAERFPNTRPPTGFAIGNPVLVTITG